MRRKTPLISFCAFSMLSVAIVALAAPQFGRRHRVTTAGTLEPIPATNTAGENQVSIEIRGSDRIIQSNGIPDHKTGAFPNRGNPNRIRAQRYNYRIPAKPESADRTTPISGVFGIAVNGVPFDPGAAEFYNGRMGSKWQYEPLSGAINLGIDVSHAHVQPDGAYHYHGLPTDLLSNVKLNPERHSPIVGWAADGFPIYAMYGHKDPSNPSSPVVALRSSYQLKQGARPGGNEPDGTFDGTFVADYEYVAGSGDLDECNGRFVITDEFPDGTYAYFLSENWPVIPRNFRGTPSSDFLRRGPGPGLGREAGSAGNRGSRRGPRARPGRRPPPRGGGTAQRRPE